MEDQDQNQQNPEDVVAFDVPMFLRLLEFAREDATDDEALHQATSKIIELSAPEFRRKLNWVTKLLSTIWKIPIVEG
jgi:hypothetical protein